MTLSVSFIVPIPTRTFLTTNTSPTKSTFVNRRPTTFRHFYSYPTSSPIVFALTSTPVHNPSSSSENSDPLPSVLRISSTTSTTNTTSPTTTTTTTTTTTQPPWHLTQPLLSNPSSSSSSTPTKITQNVKLIPPSPSQKQDKPPSTPIWPRLLALFVAAVFGTNFPVVKFLQSGHDALPASIAAVARFSLAASALIPFSLYEIYSSSSSSGSSSQTSKKTLPKSLVSISSIIGIPVFFGYFTQALSLDGTDAGKSAFLCSLAVVIVPFLQRFFPFTKTLSSSTTRSNLFSTWGAPILAVIGVAFLELSDTSSMPTISDIWGLLQAFAFGIGFIMNERAALLFPGFSLTISALQLSTISFCSLIWAIMDSHSFPILSNAFSTPQISTALLYAGLISTALTVVLSNVALSRVTAAELTVLLSTEPCWAAVFSNIALHETMGSGAIIGAFLILMACIINQAQNIPILNQITTHFKKNSIIATPLASFSAFVSSIQDLFNKFQPPMA